MARLKPVHPTLTMQLALDSFHAWRLPGEVRRVGSWDRVLPPGGMLLRDLIKLALYDPNFGYFSASPDVVGKVGPARIVVNLRCWIRA